MGTATGLSMTRESYRELHERLKPYIHHTPVLSSTYLNHLSGTKLYFKCENFQRMGAFKMRGAMNAILNLSRSKQSNGVVTHSSGNFGQAVALAASELEIPAFIVMPENAPSVKIEAVKGYGGQVILCKPDLESRKATAESIGNKYSAVLT